MPAASTPPAPTAKRRGARRGLRLLLIAVASALLLEGVLQVASFVAFLSYSREQVSAGADGGATILCVGDSYTYGLGASSAEHTYPAVMRQALGRTGGVEPTVINAGWPSQNSRDVLTKLDEQLTSYSPDLVFILVGLNDTWSKPAAVTVDGSSAGGRSNWHWRWRTGRLFAWAFGGSSSPPAGSTIPPDPEPRPAPVLPANATDFDRGFACFGSGDMEGAVKAFRAALQSMPEQEAMVHLGLTQVLTALGRSEAARASVQWLETECDRAPTQATTESLVQALVAVRENGRALAVAQKGVESYPRSMQLWYWLAEQYYRTWDLQRAEEAYDRALLYTPPGDRAWRPIIMRSCARACYARDARKSLRLVISSLLLDNDLGKCIVALKPGRSSYSAELANEVLAELKLDATGQQAAQRLIAVMLTMTDVPTKDEAMCQVLESHLRQMIASCEEHGIRPILMTYPMPMPFVAAVVAAVANDTGVPMVDLQRRFDDAAAGQPKAQLFIPDGHCSDRGYAIMGEAAADAAAAVLQR